MKVYICPNCGTKSNALVHCVKLIQENHSKESWGKQSSICSRCSREVSNKTYYGSSHFKGTCSPRWKTDRTRFQYELKNRRPRYSDWRWRSPYHKIMKAQGSLLDELCPPETKTEKDPNQLEFKL